MPDHPRWCDLDRCTAFDERPNSAHMSTPVVVPSVHRGGEVGIEACLVQPADEPVDAALVLSFRDDGAGLLPFQFAVELELPKLLGLLDVLAPLLETLRAHNADVVQRTALHDVQRARTEQRRIEPGNSGPGW